MYISKSLSPIHRVSDIVAKIRTLACSEDIEVVGQAVSSKSRQICALDLEQGSTVTQTEVQKTSLPRQRFEMKLSYDGACERRVGAQCGHRWSLVGAGEQTERRSGYREYSKFMSKSTK